MRVNSNPWIVCPRPVPGAQLRLFCLPHAGGGAQLFRDWETALPSTVELCAVRPPGRESRVRETAYSDVQPLVEAMSKALAGHLDRPFILLGHSMGALLGYELARALRRSAGPQPVHLIACGHRGPHLPYPERPIAHLPREAFVKELRRYNGTPQEAIDSPELMELLLPLLQADFSVCETYAHREEAPLDCPITASGGRADPAVGRSDLEAWAEHTTGSCVVRMFPGDHFFLRTARALFLQTLSRELHGHLDTIA